MFRATWRRRLAAALLLLVVVAGFLAAPASAADRPASPAAAESQFLNLLNQRRQSQGLAPLSLDAGLERDARSWSATMAGQNSMVHAPNNRLMADLGVSVPGWTGGGENIGKGWDVPGLDDAFWNSPTHRANILGNYNRVGIGVVYTPQALWVTFRFANGPALPAAGGALPQGDLWMADVKGRVITSGNATHYGDAREVPLNRPVVAMVATRSRHGYWLLGQDGGVFSFGDARFFGSTGGIALNQPVNGMAATPSGNGYYLVASDGGVFAYGDARFFGSTGGIPLNQPVNGMAVTPSGNGYWLVASDGGLFSFGDAGFHGSAATAGLGAPTVGITTTPSGRGYWIAASNGRVAAFGDARPLGDAAGRTSAPIARIQATPDGRGYWLVGRDGSTYAFGSAGGGVSAPLSTTGIVAVAPAR